MRLFESLWQTPNIPLNIPKPKNLSYHHKWVGTSQNDRFIIWPPLPAQRVASSSGQVGRSTNRDSGLGPSPKRKHKELLMHWPIRLTAELFYGNMIWRCKNVIYIYILYDVAVKLLRVDVISLHWQAPRLCVSRKSTHIAQWPETQHWTSLHHFRHGIVHHDQLNIQTRHVYQILCICHTKDRVCTVVMFKS